MAFTSGTAANYKDLLAAMVTFATANGWVALEQSETNVYLKGTGLTGLDEIYVGIQTFENPTSGIYNWNMYGSWGYRAGRVYAKMPRTSSPSASDMVVCHFWNAVMDYWISANPRRIILCAKVGSTYQMVHLGLLTVPATEAQYPYPLFIGGTSNSNIRSYSSTTIGSFWTQYGSTNYDPGKLHTPGGSWANMGASNTGHSEYNPICYPQIITTPFEGTLLTGLDGSYLIEPVYLCGAKNATYGVVEGLYRVTGYNNTAENIITVDGVNYMVFQDTFRSTYQDFCCMRMN